MKSAITVSLVDEARGGPFVFWDDLEVACGNARELGFDAIELFAPGPDVVDIENLTGLLERYDLDLAAVGTGAGWVIQGLQLCSPDATERRQARDYIRSMIDYGANFKAPAIIGSMQGRWTREVPRETALEYLREGLNELGQHASDAGVPLIYEPLNRYETNLTNTMSAGVELLESLETRGVVLLADLFHMHIEEQDLATAIRSGGKCIGHVHFVDSNRQAAGRGHMDFLPIIAALKEIGYSGYLSAEAFPLPDSQTAAEATIHRFRKLLSP